MALKFTSELQSLPKMSSPSANFETFEMGPFTVPRIWTGLWQVSSDEWQIAPTSQIHEAMERYAKVGYIAFGECHPCIKTECCHDHVFRHGKAQSYFCQRSLISVLTVVSV
jgi:hypothetical protein